MASYCILRSKSLLANVALELQPLFGQQVVRAMAGMYFKFAFRGHNVNVFIF